MTDVPVVIDLRSTLPFEPGTLAPKGPDDKRSRRKRIYALPDNEWLIANFVTIENIEWRIQRAMNTIRATPDPEARFRAGLKAAWPSFEQDAEDLAERWNDRDERANFEKKAQKFRPTPRDESDCLTALEWLRGVPMFDYEDGLEIPRITYRDPLSKGQVKLLAWRASGCGPAFIADRLNITKQAVHDRYKVIIQGLFHAAVQHALERARRAARRSLDISGPSLKDDLTRARSRAEAPRENCPGGAFEGSGAERGGEGAIRF